ncbi:TetR/AcrR family transcriptional regulator C-terminal domain-containing protein [Streptomyces sp. NBC_01443]|uniref:TetR/AcrR family transcriptional regulator C-terminal domain-containing protein n=1 Tax=Streptomyces sp. NBC_01443 TaxID=2903868 RepID=UPI0022532BEC|nr:TetR/AcrR family transcriptional regulator C-terminal domain-containing protein [Streptomyces sp. NBC_01443]MCX4631812.1 TetR/AcrR family transcriptional regulator C-terminal domain-containing protein [Streptomyces sp. NBC_01443]
MPVGVDHAADGLLLAHLGQFRDQIVRAAIELLDAEGIEGLSMRKLGQRLGSAPTAMYWHVGNKENLVVLAADRVWGEIEPLDPGSSGWRAAARALAYDAHALAARHPWLINAISMHFVYGDGMARFQDHSYAVYEAAGFTGWDLDWAVNTAYTFVAGSAIDEAMTAAMAKAQIRPGRGAEGDGPVQDVVTWATGIASRYPRLRARLEGQAMADPAEMTHQKFEFGIEAILDGLEARLARQST